MAADSSLGLQEKLLRIDESKRRFTARRVTNIGKALGLSVVNELRHASSKHLTPSFVAAKRRKRKEEQEEARQIEVRRQTQIALDEKLEATRIARRKTIQAQLNAQRRITLAAPTVERSRALKNTYYCQELSRRLEDRDCRNDEQRREAERRKMAALAAEAKRLADAEIERRQKAAAYWAQQAKATREEANAMKSKSGTIGCLEESAPNRACEEETIDPLNHPACTIFQTSQSASSMAESCDTDNRYSALFSTKHSYDGEVARAKASEVEALECRYNGSLLDLQSRVDETMSKKAELVTERKNLQSSIASNEMKIDTIIADLKLPYPREPNEQQKIEIHQLKSRIAEAKQDIHRTSNALYTLDTKRGAPTDSIVLMRRRRLGEKAECSKRILLTEFPDSPPMVLGQALGSLSNLGDIPNPSKFLEAVVTGAELELQRNALPSRQSIVIKRRTNRRKRDQTRRNVQHVEDMIADRAKEIESLSRQLWKKRREVLMKDIIAFTASGRILRTTPGKSLEKNIVEDLCASMKRFDQRKLTENDCIGLATRGLCLGDEYCIYHLNEPIGIHKTKLCHDKSMDESNASDLDPLMEDRRSQEERKAAHDDNIDFVGRIQGYRKKLRALESTQAQLRERYAEAVDSLHTQRALFAIKEGAEQMSTLSLEEAESKTKQMKHALLNLSSEMQSKRAAMRSLERKYLRTQRLMLRRSILSKSFFSRERHRLLLDAFERWKHYKDWAVETKEMIARKKMS